MPNIVNPYIAGNPVTRSEMFFNREDIFEFIHRTLIGKHRDNVIVLYGQRRTGKTSILNQMRSHLDPRYLCIFIDLQGFELQGINGFLWELANHIVRGLRRDYQIDLPYPNHVEFQADARSAFENEFLDRVWSACGDQHLLLMLDEVILLQVRVDAGKLEPEIFAYMRHLMQQYERLNFLFSLGSGLEELKKNYAFLFNVGLYKKISFLDRNSASDLITQPVKGYYQVEPAALERILQITSGHPYYTQLLCHCLCNRWQQSQASSIAVQDVDSILNEVVERGLAVLKHVWEESTPSEKAVLAGMAAAMKGINCPNCPIRASAITHALARCDLVIPQGELVNAIRRLIAREVITGRDQYLFTVDLLRLWVQQYERLEWVKEEIADAVREWSASPEIVKPHFPYLISRHALKSRTFLLVGLALLIIVGIVAAMAIPIHNNQVANSNATATAIASTYPFSSRQVLNDPLRDNSRGYGWEEGTESFGRSCTSTGGYYHVSADIGFTKSCLARYTKFSSFTFEVQMKILKGVSGGIGFRSSSTGTYPRWVFLVSSNGIYNLIRYSPSKQPKQLAWGTLPSSARFKTGLDQSNRIAIVIRSSTITLYVNEQNVSDYSDNLYNLYRSSQIDLDAFPYEGSSSPSPTEVVYSNAKAWTLSS